MRFSFNSEIYVQTDRIALSSPLENKTKMWKRYVDNIYHLFCKNGLNNLILTTLNSFHSNIKFTIEIKKDSVIPFFSILVSYQNTKQNTEQYTIKKNKFWFIYSLKFFHTNQMEMGNNKTLVHRAYDICSTDQYLEIELKHIQSRFNNLNGYPHWILSRVFNNAFQSYYDLFQVNWLV